VEDFERLAFDLLWTWQPRIQNLFRTLDAEKWEQTHQNPVLLLKQLGAEGIAEACKRDEVKRAFDDAGAAYDEYYRRNPPFLDAHAPLVIAAAKYLPVSRANSGARFALRTPISA